MFIRIAVLLAFFTSNLSLATTLENPNQLYKITHQAQFVFDSSHSWTIDSALTHNDWSNVQKNRINFSFIDSPVWVRFPVKSQIDAEWIMLIGYPLLDYIDVYHVRGDKVLKKYETGDLRSFDQRPINHPNFVFPIKIPLNQEHWIYIRVETKGAAELPIWFEEKSKFESDNQTREFLRGWVNGILAIMLFYNLFIFLFIKERVYIFYVVNAGVYLIQLSIYDGSGFQHFWPESPELNHYMFPFFNGLMQLTQFLFLVTFLEVLSRQSWYVKPVKIILAIMCTLPILGLIIDYRIIVPIQVLFALIVNASGLAFGIYFSLKGETSARYFTVAWALFLVGLFITNLKSLGLVPNNAFTQYSYQIGAFVEMAILSLALAQRIEQAKTSLISLQNEHISTLQNYQSLYNNSLSGQFQSNRNGLLLSVNPAFEKLFNPHQKWHLNTREEKHYVTELIVRETDLKTIDDTLKSQCAIVDYEIQLQNSDQEIRWYSLSVRPNLCEESDNVKYEGSIIDINERKENEAIREQAMIDRMATLEQLSIGICHEINTPLGISITGTSHLDGLLNEISNLVEQEQLTKKQLLSILTQEKESVELIDNGLSRVSDLIRQFKQVSVSQLGFDIDDLPLIETLNNLQHEMKQKHPHINLDIHCNQGLTFRGYHKAVHLVLSELIANSILHSFESIEEGFISIQVQAEEGDLIIDYKDNGQGIDSDKHHELFNAFYTTKRGSHGRIGLGLYQVFNLVSQLLRGKIELQAKEHIHYFIRFPANITINQ